MRVLYIAAGATALGVTGYLVYSYMSSDSDDSGTKKGGSKALAGVAGAAAGIVVNPLKHEFKAVSRLVHGDIGGAADSYVDAVESSFLGKGTRAVSSQMKKGDRGGYAVGSAIDGTVDNFEGFASDLGHGNLGGAAEHLFKATPVYQAGQFVKNLVTKSPKEKAEENEQKRLQNIVKADIADERKRVKVIFDRSLRHNWSLDRFKQEMQREKAYSKAPAGVKELALAGEYNKYLKALQESLKKVWLRDRVDTHTAHTRAQQNKWFGGETPQMGAFLADYQSKYRSTWEFDQFKQVFEHNLTSHDLHALLNGKSWYAGAQGQKDIGTLMGRYDDYWAKRSIQWGLDNGKTPHTMHVKAQQAKVFGGETPAMGRFLQEYTTKYNAQRANFKLHEAERCGKTLTKAEAIAYGNRYPDLHRAFGNDYGKLAGHWLAYGCREGRVYTVPKEVGTA